MSNTLKDLRFKIWIAFLTFLSGFINVGAIRSFSLPVSHHTGNVSHLALSIVHKNIAEVCIITSAILAFFAGAFISGLLFHQRKFGLKKRYGILLMGLAMIFLSLALFKTPQILKVFALSFAAGVQNAMFIFYGDILVRTTHITGYLTDAAFALAMCLRGKKDKFRFFLFYSLNILFFLAGGIIAGLIKISSFFIASACLYLIAGLYYFMMREKQ
jgi:putative membrane protein